MEKDILCEIVKFKKIGLCGFFIIRVIPANLFQAIGIGI